MKIREMLELEEKLNKLLEKKLPIRVSYLIIRNLSHLDESTSDFEALRLSLIEKYGNKDQNGDLCVDEQNNAKIEDSLGFMKELNDLLETDEPIEFKKISLTDLMECDDSKYDQLTVGEIRAMDCMIADGVNDGG